jgi:inhibitor of KinA
VKFEPLGDSAITVFLGDGISRELSADVQQLADALRSESIAGVIEVVPAYASVAAYYDPLGIGYDELMDSVRALRTRMSRTPASIPSERRIRIPVRYDGEDLTEVADRTGHTRDEVIGLHADREYHVYVVGFVPGFAYLGELDPSLVLPRRSVPRKRVPAGAVAIAEAQTGIYPYSTPGGWHLIGTTIQKMFDPSATEPALLRVGDRVIFEPVG